MAANQDEPGRNAVVCSPVPVASVRRRGVVPAAVAVLFGVSLTSGYYAVRPASAARPAGLTADPPAHTFPDLRQGQIVRAEFRLVNNHPGPVRIDGVDTFCGCQAADFTPGDIHSGETRAVGITWRMEGKRGRVSDVAWVRYTDPAGQPQRQPLLLNAEVTPDIRCEPSRLEFTAGRPQVLRLKLSPGGMPAFRVKGLYANSRQLAVTWEVETNEAVVRYIPADDEKIGPGPAVQIETDSPNEPVIEVPVFIMPPKQAAALTGEQSCARC